MRNRLLAGLVGLCVVVPACSRERPHPTDVTITRTQTLTRSPTAIAFTPAAPTSVVPLSPDQNPPAGEREASCPYIASTSQQNPSANVEDIEGDHVLRTTVLTATSPVGCRFYFYRPPTKRSPTSCRRIPRRSDRIRIGYIRWPDGRHPATEGPKTLVETRGIEPLTPALQRASGERYLRV